MDSDTQVQTSEVLAPKRGPVFTNQSPNEDYNNGKFDFEFVMFTDESRSAVNVAFFDSEGWGRIEVHSCALVPGSMFTKILSSGMSVEDIDDMTDYFAASEAAFEAELEEFRAWKRGELESVSQQAAGYTEEVESETEVQVPEPIVETIVETKIEEVPVEVPTISVNHMAQSFSQEDLFRMKIEVFDIPSVRAGGKEIKSRIRKATTPVEIFAIIHEANVSFESE